MFLKRPPILVPDQECSWGGVGHYMFPVFYLRKRAAGGIPKSTVTPLVGYSQFDVFRHVDAKTSEFKERFVDQVTAISSRYLDHPYASANDLAAVSVLPSIVKLISTIIESVPSAHRPGLFCSQLVATIFRDTQFELFQTDPKHITPGDLPKSKKLQCITDEVRFAVQVDDELATGFEVAESMLPGVMEKLGTTPPVHNENLVGHRAFGWEFRESIEEIDRSNQQIIAMLNEIKRLRAQALANEQHVQPRD